MLAYITTILWQKNFFFFKPQFPFNGKQKQSHVLKYVHIFFAYFLFTGRSKLQQLWDRSSHSPEVYLCRDI